MQSIRIFFLGLSLFIGGILFYDVITVGYQLSTIFFAGTFAVCSLIAALIPAESKIIDFGRRTSSFVIWFVSTLLLFNVICIVHATRNLSPVLFSTRFFWDEGLAVDFRKDGTYRAINEDMFSKVQSYGRYRLQDSIIILDDKLMFGMSYLTDTLVVSKKGLSFSLEKPWRIEEGVMHYTHHNGASLPIENRSKYD